MEAGLDAVSTLKMDLVNTSVIQRWEIKMIPKVEMNVVTEMAKISKAALIFEFSNRTIIAILKTDSQLEIHDFTTQNLLFTTS